MAFHSIEGIKLEAKIWQKKNWGYTIEVYKIKCGVKKVDRDFGTS